jgi:hypothetical protein
VRDDYECEDEREKNKKRKKIIFISRTCINYLYWVIQVRSSWAVLKLLTLTQLMIFIY